MEAWHFEPARDLGLSRAQRRRSLLREVGLESAISCFLWRTITRMLSRDRASPPDSWPQQSAGAPSVCARGQSCQSSRCRCSGRNFANAFCWRSVPDRGWRHVLYQARVIHLRHGLHERAADVAKNCGAHSLEDLRERLVGGECVYILFPEGTRTRTGAMGKFKPGLGRLVAGTQVPDRPLLFARAV